MPYTDAAQALALAGHADRAAETLAALDALGVPAMLMNETEVLQARAWTAAAAGDLPAARQRLEMAADLGEEIGDLIGAVSALHGLARLGHARQVSARLASLATQVDGDLAAARAAYASALAARDSEVLGKVADDFEDLGTILYAAEATPRPPSCCATPERLAGPPPPSSGPRGCWPAAKGPPRPRSGSSPPGCG